MNLDKSTTRWELFGRYQTVLDLKRLVGPCRLVWGGAYFIYSIRSLVTLSHIYISLKNPLAKKQWSILTDCHVVSCRKRDN